MSGILTTPFKLFETFETNARGVIRRRSLRYDINALADFEQLTGMGFGQLMHTKAVFATARAMLWCGLKHEDRTLTVEQVGTLMFQYMKEMKGSIDELLTACFEAANEQGAFGDMTGDGESDAGNAPDSENEKQLNEAPETGESGFDPSKTSPMES